MNAIELKPIGSAQLPTISEHKNNRDRVTALAHQNLYIHNQQKFGNIAALPLKVIKDAGRWAHAHIIKDHEKMIDFAGKGAANLDLALTWLSAPIQGAAFLGQKIDQYIPFSQWILLAKIIIFPIGIALLALTAVQIVYETVNMVRVCRLIERVAKARTPEEKLEILRARFFGVSAVQHKQLQAYVDKLKQSGVSDAVLAERYNHIIEKLLAVKYAELSRRVAPWCAKELNDQLQGLLLDLKSSDPKVRAMTCIRANTLLDDVKTQCLKKLLVHFVGLISLGFFVLSMILLYAAFPIGAAITTISILGVIYSIAHHLLDQGLLTQRGWNFSLSACLPEFLRGKGKPEPVAHGFQ